MNNSIGFYKRLRLFKNPGVLFFLSLSIVSYIYKNYFISTYINIMIIFQFTLVWLLLFIIYNIILLYVTNSIIPSSPEVQLSEYWPKFIKNKFELIYALVAEDKQRAVQTQIRIVFMYVLLLVLIIVMYSILFYFIE